MSMSINKLFNNWISKNFKGLSAHTLCQVIKSEMMLPVTYINNMVYVDLFHVFTNSANEDEQNSFDTVSIIVAQCNYL